MKKLFTFLLLAISVSAFSVKVTFKVDMKGSGMTYDTVFVVGTVSDWSFIEMKDEGDSIWSATLNLNEGDTAVYYFITQGNWENYLDFRETVPEECAQSDEVTGDTTWVSDRGFMVGADNIEVTHVWGSCEEIAGPTSVSNVESASFDIYPNPADDFVNINFSEFDGAVQVELLDLSGKILVSNHLTASDEVYTLQLEELPQGLYLLKVSDSSSTGIRKISIR